MAELTETSPGAVGGAPERLAAHQRLSTGALARWARANATHPWRVIGAWVGIVAVLIVLVGAVGGSLRDEFKIPGSDAQRATDLIESEFASEQGSVLNVVFAAPEGQRLDTPGRKAAIQKAMAELRSPEFKATKDKAGLTSVANPFAKDTFSSNGRIAYAEAQFDRVIYDGDRDSVVSVEDAVRKAVEPAGVTVEYNGEAEFPPVEQGTSETLGLLAALVVLLIVFRTFVATAIPIALAISAIIRPSSSCGPCSIGGNSASPLNSTVRPAGSTVSRTASWTATTAARSLSKMTRSNWASA